MRTKTSLFVVVCGVAALTSFTTRPSAQSAPNIIMETSFQCADWNQSMGLGDAQVCGPADGIAGWGGWTTTSGNGDSVTAAANNPSGAGGKGFRSMVGPGTNVSGGGFRFQFPYEVRELWVRFYMRHQSGFSWQNGQPHYEKNLYFNDTIATGSPVFIFGYGNGLWGVHKVNPGSDHLTDSTTRSSWNDIEGAVGDGRFHYYEVHVKMDTNGSNGIAESWVDGRQVARYTNVNWNGSIGWTGWKYFSGAINQNYVTNSTDMYVDYDDIALSTTGYIGPYGGGQSSSGAAPSAPLNLRIAP